MVRQKELLTGCLFQAVEALSLLYASLSLTEANGALRKDSPEANCQKCLERCLCSLAPPNIHGLARFTGSQQGVPKTDPQSRVFIGPSSP